MNMEPSHMASSSQSRTIMAGQNGHFLQVCLISKISICSLSMNSLCSVDISGLQIPALCPAEFQEAYSYANHSQSFNLPYHHTSHNLGF